MYSISKKGCGQFVRECGQLVMGGRVVYGVGMLLQKRANTSAALIIIIIIIGIRNIMRKSIYLLTTTPTNHTYTL